MRTIFFGTPEIAVPALEALAETTELCAVVCQPDRPSGRGLALHAPAIKRVAERLGVEVHQPVKVKTGNLHEWIAERRLSDVSNMPSGAVDVLQAAEVFDLIAYLLAERPPEE